MKLQRFLLMVVVIASLGANAYFVLQRMTAAQGRTSVTHSALDQIEVMRTNGGLLQVSTIRSPELFQATQDHTIFGVHVGKTISQIRVPATFHYHVELAPEWKITVRNNTFIVIAPRVKPTLPVAIDTAKLEKLTSGTWSLLTGTSELDQPKPGSKSGNAAVHPASTRSSPKNRHRVRHQMGCRTKRRPARHGPHGAGIFCG